VIFHRNQEYCHLLCSLLLNACNSPLAEIREHGCALLYLLLKEDSSRVSLEVTVALSKLEHSHNADTHLRASLASIGDFSRHEGSGSGSDGQFSRDVSKLMERLAQILSDTAVMREYGNDHEMLADLQYRVAESFSKTPVLHLAWLERVAKLHLTNQNWSEAAMCVCQCAALVAEYLTDLAEPMIPSGAKAFGTISPTLARVKLDSYQEADGFTTADLAMTSPLFSERGLLTMLPRVVDLFKRAQRYELVSKVYGLFTPMYERDRKYQELADAANDMKECYERVVKVGGMITPAMLTMPAMPVVTAPSPPQCVLFLAFFRAHLHTLNCFGLP